MPHLGVKLHLWWFERVIRGNINVNYKNASKVWSIIRSEDLAFPMSNIVANNFSFHNLFTLCVFNTLLELF